MLENIYLGETASYLSSKLIGKSLHTGKISRRSSETSPTFFLDYFTITASILLVRNIAFKEKRLSRQPM